MKITQKKIIMLEILLLLTLGISHVLSMSTINIIISMAVFVLFIISNLRTDIILLFTALPFFNLFTTNIGTTSLFYLYVIAFLFKYIYQNRNHLNKTKILVFILLITVRIPSGDIASLTKWALLLSVLVFTYNEEFFIDQTNDIVKWLSISFVLSSVFGYYMLQNGLSIYTNSYIYVSHELVVTRFAGLIGDSVFYSQFASLLIASNLVINYYNSSGRVFRYIIVTILTIFVILTYSKTGIILALISIILYIIAFIYNNIKSRKNFLKTSLIIIIIVACITLGIKYVLNHTNNLIISNYITRFSASDLLTGRTEIYEHYTNLLKNNIGTPFFAMPQKQYMELFITSRGNKLNRAHNIYLETVCAFGIFTTIIILLWVGYKVIKVLMQRNRKICLLPFLIIFASGFTLHGHFEYHYYFLVSLAILFLNNKITETISVNLKEGD